MTGSSELPGRCEWTFPRPLSRPTAHPHASRMPPPGSLRENQAHEWGQVPLLEESEAKRHTSQSTPTGNGFTAGPPRAARSAGPIQGALTAPLRRACRRAEHKLRRRKPPSSDSVVAAKRTRWRVATLDTSRHAGRKDRAGVGRGATDGAFAAGGDGGAAGAPALKLDTRLTLDLGLLHQRHDEHRNEGRGQNNSRDDTRHRATIPVLDGCDIICRWPPSRIPQVIEVALQGQMARLIMEIRRSIRRRRHRPRVGSTLLRPGSRGECPVQRSHPALGAFRPRPPGGESVLQPLSRQPPRWADRR